MDHNSKKVGDVMRKVLSNSPLGTKLKEYQVVSLWNKLLGPSIAKHTSSIFVKNRVLYVTLDSSVMRQELHYGKSKIITMINEQLGEELVKDLMLK